MEVIVYGSRGSIPFANAGRIYGGNTSCIVIKSFGQELVFDAGSGIYGYSNDLIKIFGPSFASMDRIHILLSHLHLDHIVGLGVFSPIWRGAHVNIYTVCRAEGSGRSLRDQVLSIFSPPYWPRAMNELSNVKVLEIKEDQSFQVGVFTITPFLAHHTDRTVSFCVFDGEKRILHLLDSEYSSSTQIDNESHSKYYMNADLVVFDACYMPHDYPKYAGWGHSTVEHGVRFAKRWGVKQMLFSHFAQQYSDGEIAGLARYFGGNNFMLSRDGLVFTI